MKGFAKGSRGNACDTSDFDAGVDKRNRCQTAIPARYLDITFLFTFVLGGRGSIFRYARIKNTGRANYPTQEIGRNVRSRLVQREKPYNFITAETREVSRVSNPG